MSTWTSSTDFPAPITDDDAVPRVSETVDDRTPITASRIDVGARIGWLLRTHRSVAGLSLRQMSAGLKGYGVSLSAASLSRIESEGHRSPAALDGYARVLGLTDGALRAPVDLLCRTFPYAPEAPPRVAGSLEQFSRAFEAIDVPNPTGAAWQQLAQQHAHGDFGLPRSLIEPHVRRLAMELTRSTGVARFTRIEALSTLRCSAYGDLVADVVRSIVLAPDAQNTWDLVTAVTECPSPGVLDWLASLLRHPSLYVAQGASYGLQGMLVIGGLGLEEWTGLVPHVELARRDAGADPSRRGMLTQLCAALPPRLQETLHETCRPEPTAPRGPAVWSRSRQNLHYVAAEHLARTVTGLMAHPEEPLLARLLFEALFDPRGVRMSTATYTLAFSPFAGTLVQVLLEQRDGLPGDPGGASALRVAAFCHEGETPPGLERLLGSQDETVLQHVLAFCSRGSRPVPQALVDRGLSGVELTVRRTLSCLGMLGDPRLREIAEDPALPSSTRGGARWWIEHGPRVPV